MSDKSAIQAETEGTNWEKGADQNRRPARGEEKSILDVK